MKVASDTRAADAVDASWPEPDTALVRPERPMAPKMSPDELLTVFGPWAGWLETAANVKSAPVDFVALALLSTASAVIGNTRWVTPWEGWKEPPIIWGMLVGDPSSGKSPALDAVLDAVKEIDAALGRAYQQDRSEWEGKDELAKLVLGQWKADTKDALKSGLDAPEKPKQADAGRPPVRKRIRVTDTTTEKAADLLRDSWRGLLVSRDELSGFLASMDRYNGGGDREFWLETFGGRSFTIDRKSSPEPIIVDHMSIAVLGGTQPEKLDSFLVGCADDGLLSRFLVVFPDPVPLDRPSSVLDAGFVQKALARLHALEPRVLDNEEKKPVLVPLTEAAQSAFQAFRVQNRAREADVSGMMKSHIGKLPGLVLRTALVLALLDSAADDIGLAVESIDQSHIERASLYVGQHLRRHAERTYGAAALPPERQAANRISEIILKKGMDEIGTREIHRLGLVGLLSAKEIGPAFAVLESADWIRQLPSNGPGRPSKRFAVNPKVKGLATGGMKGA